MLQSHSLFSHQLPDIFVTVSSNLSNQNRACYTGACAKMPIKSGAGLGGDESGYYYKSLRRNSASGEFQVPAYYSSLAPQGPQAPFRFGARRVRIDWRVLHGIDIDRVVSTNQPVVPAPQLLKAQQ